MSTRTFLRASGRYAVTVALVGGGLLVALPTIAPSTATTSPGTPVHRPAGVVTLRTGAVDVIAYDRNLDGTAESTQALQEGNKCQPITGESLLGIDGTVGASSTDVAGYGNNSLGVSEKWSGTSCSMVDAATAERLTLRFDGTSLADAFGRPLAASAYLDVELKQGARIQAVAWRGTRPMASYELQSGGSIGLPAAPPPAGLASSEVWTCSTAADSGPDSGVSDNCRWPISRPSWLGADDGVVFDRLTLTALAGSFGLEGGGDGTVTQVARPAGGVPPTGTVPSAVPAGATVFELVDETDGILGCGDTTETEPASGSAPQVTVSRGPNADGSTCTPIPYRLTNGSSRATFLKPLDAQSSAQFVVDFVWNVTARADTSLPVTQVNFANVDDPASNIALGWCPDPQFVQDAGGLRLTGIAIPGAVPDLSSLPGTQYACVGSQEARPGPGSPTTVTVVEQVYLIGDVLMRK